MRTPISIFVSIATLVVPGPHGLAQEEAGSTRTVEEIVVIGSRFATGRSASDAAAPLPSTAPTPLRG